MDVPPRRSLSHRTRPSGPIPVASSWESASVQPLPFPHPIATCVVCTVAPYPDRRGVPRELGYRRAPRSQAVHVLSRERDAEAGRTNQTCERFISRSLLYATR